MNKAKEGRKEGTKEGRKRIPIDAMNETQVGLLVFCFFSCFFFVWMNAALAQKECVSNDAKRMEGCRGATNFEEYGRPKGSPSV